MNLNIVIHELLHYSFRDVDWKFDELTEREQEIVGDQETLDKLREYVDSLAKGPSK